MTHQQKHIIYVPGIRDDIYHVQSLATVAWALFGVRGHCHVMPWVGRQPYKSKLQCLSDEVESHKAQGHRVFLAGASAGASAVINLYVDHPGKIDGVALICPKINHPETVRSAVYEANPAYRTALTMLQSNLARLTPHDKARIVIYYSPRDGVVPYADSQIPGVKEYRLPPVWHGYAIMYALTFGSLRLCTRLKRLTVA